MKIVQVTPGQSTEVIVRILGPYLTLIIYINRDKLNKNENSKSSSNISTTSIMTFGFCVTGKFFQHYFMFEWFSRK